MPTEGSLVWIRQRRWRVERARRENNLVRLDVVGRSGRVTFLAPFDRPCTTGSPEGMRRVRPQAFVARLAGVVGRATSCRTVSSALDAAIELLPYQLEPALAMLRGDRRILIADAVGLGKTIQAGLAIAELQKREPSLRALVLVPSALLAQWSDELRGRFKIDARHAESESLAQLARSGARYEAVWSRPGVWIASLDYVKQPHVIGPARRRPWDLLVVDEAHGACGDTERHRAAADLARRSRRVLLLTATPHNGDEDKFDRLLALGALPCDPPAPTIFRRTRAILGREAPRRLRWHTVRLSPEETRLLDVLGDFERAVLRTNSDAQRPTALLLLSVFRKRALSTATAFVVSVDRRLSWIESRGTAADAGWRQPRLTFEGDEDAITRDEHECLTADLGLGPDLERSWLKGLLEIGRAAEGRESKIRYLESLLRRTTEPVVVFTEFRDSLEALRRRLNPVRRLAALHGGLTPHEQHEQLEGFRCGADSALLATDVASQGLNLHARCRWVLNLELPWTPVRIEQRAGRVDRLGQRRPVHVGLLVSDHQSESGMLARLIRRTLVARHTLGADVFTLRTPDESSVRSHLLAGTPLAEPDASHRVVSICRRWARPAARAGRHLERQRSLARCWRTAPHIGSCYLARLDRLPVLRQLTHGQLLLCFLVPFVDAWGAVLERRVFIVQTDRLAGLRDRNGLEEIRRCVAHLLAPRARRLQRLRRAEVTRMALRERAIHDVLRRSCGLTGLQPGLFDRRAIRAGERAADEIAELDGELNARLHALEAGGVVVVGAATLAFAAAAEATQ